MKDLPRSKLDETKDLITRLDPDKTIFYFDNHYHAVKNNWLTEIPADEAEQSLRDPEFDLLNLGSPPDVLPESCPSFIYTNVFVRGPVGELLQLMFDAKFNMNLADMYMDKIISKN
jgi:hypothetical protein